MKSCIQCLHAHAFHIAPRGRQCHDRMVVEFTIQLPVQSVPITTKVVSLNPAHGKMYSMQHYVIKFVSVIGFLHQ